MNKEQLLKFRELFEKQKKDLLYRMSMQQDVALAVDDLQDEGDLSRATVDQNLQIRLQGRDGLLLKKIESALSKISTGTFGTCESCEEEIEPKRLEARPTASLCLSCKESQEKQEFHFMGSRNSKRALARLKIRTA